MTNRWLPAELDRFGRPLAAVDAMIRLAASRHRLPDRIVDLEFDGRKLLLLGVRGYGLAISRLLPDGRPDPDFGDAGMRALRVGASLRPGRIAVEPNGKIVVDGVSFASRSGSFDGEPGRAVVAGSTPKAHSTRLRLRRGVPRTPADRPPDERDRARAGVGNCGRHWRRPRIRGQKEIPPAARSLTADPNYPKR